jgi:hypothetical protein
LIVAVEGADPGRVARGLGVEPFEARQLVRRRGPSLWRIVEAGAAEAEAGRLDALGLEATTLPEATVRDLARPRSVRGGRLVGDALELRSATGPVRVERSQVILVVRGPIVREYAPSPEARRARTASLEGGYRIHLHLQASAPPLELDPGNFDFGDAVAGRSSLITLLSWTRTLGSVDDSFRLLPPALGPSAPESEGLGEAVTGLGRGRASRRGEGPVILDNLTQFRFHSAWKGALARRPPRG